jgi:hypothetical protein
MLAVFTRSNPKEARPRTDEAVDRRFGEGKSAMGRFIKMPSFADVERGSVRIWGGVDTMLLSRRGKIPVFTSKALRTGRRRLDFVR